MTRERSDINTGYLVKRYLAGATAEQLARELRIPVATVSSRIRKSGAHRPKLSHRKPVNIARIVDGFRGGMSVKAIAAAEGLTRATVCMHLREAGFAPRNRHQAMALRMANYSLEDRKRLTNAAHAAVRGRKVSLDESRRRAKAIEARKAPGSPFERKLAAMLRRRGFSVSQQKAVGRYNCDLAVGPIAVEVLGGNWHMRTHREAKLVRKIRYLMRLGWPILLVVVTKESPITRQGADEIAAWLNERRRDPSALCEYRMIRGTGEVLFTRYKGNKISIETPFSNTRNPANGQYMRIPRKAARM